MREKVSAKAALLGHREAWEMVLRECCGTEWYWERSPEWDDDDEGACYLLRHKDEGRVAEIMVHVQEHTGQLTPYYTLGTMHDIPSWPVVLSTYRESRRLRDVLEGK